MVAVPIGCTLFMAQEPKIVPNSPVNLNQDLTPNNETPKLKVQMIIKSKYFNTTLNLIWYLKYTKY